MWRKAEFSASSPVSHDPSEITIICWFAARETFLIIINVENIAVFMLLTILVETMMHFIF